MCGIFALLNDYNYNDDIKKKIIEAFKLGSKRGPDYSAIIYNNDKSTTIGFHRLSINGLDNGSNQPFDIDGIQLICNGEIYNYKELYKLVNVQPTTRSDCEIIIHLYKKYGIDKTLQLLDGVFAFCLFDNNSMYVARDPFGVRPLYFVLYNNFSYGFSSISSTLNSILDDNENKIMQFTPGTYSCYHYIENKEINIAKWYYSYNTAYFNIKTIQSYHSMNTLDINTVLQNIRNSLEAAVKKRVDNCERDIACLLSGGLDSSLITSLVNRYYTEKTGKSVKTFSIGMEGSCDLVYAKKVADFLKTEHTEICLTEKDFLQAIPEVIKHIESFDTTTVRASVGNYLVAKHIKEHCDAKVIFNGDGSDEVTGGYMYFHYAPNHYEFDIECKRLLEDIHYFDVLRSDKTIASNGLEARTPFLDKHFVSTYLSIPSTLRYETTKTYCEKYLLRKAFDNDKILPNDVLWRTKEAFSDGVSKQTRSWFKIIQEYVETDTMYSNTSMDSYRYLKPKTKEQLYYRNIYNSYYKNYSKPIPYFWMPKFIDANDASARTLDIYKNKNL